MEAARLGLHDYQLGGLRPGLGLEPWLTGPPLSTLSHALPGFLAHPQTPYASYLPTNVSLPGLVTMSSCFPTSPPPASTASSPSAAPVSPAASDGRISPGESRVTMESFLVFHSRKFPDLLKVFHLFYSLHFLIELIKKIFQLERFSYLKKIVNNVFFNTST